MINSTTTPTTTSAAPPGPAAVGEPVGPVARAVSIAGLRKSFGPNPVLRGLDLEVPAGSTTAILGPSGSGKTTLLRLLAGFARPDAGTIVVGGTLMDGPGRHVAPARRRIGYVPQEGSLFPHLDVAANVGFGLARAERKARVAELLDLTGLDGLGSRYPHQLSGGQQQRVALARALAPRPSLVLLDEPFSSLDALLRTSVRLDVTRILHQAGTTTLLVTHDQGEALAMADKIAVLRGGQVAQAGTPEDVYDRPVDSDLASFVGEANLLAGVVRTGRAHTGFGTLALARGPAGFHDGDPALVLLRPEQLRVVADGTSGSVAGVVAQRDYHGHDTMVAIEAKGDGLPATLSVRCSDARALVPGARVALVADGPVMAWPPP